MSGAETCTCPHAVQRLGRLHGIDMGKGVVRLSTRRGCPVHDACHGYTAAVRKDSSRGYWLWCPIHGGNDCPQATP